MTDICGGTCGECALCAWRPVDPAQRGRCQIGPNQGKRRGSESPPCRWYVELAALNEALRRGKKVSE